MISIQNQVSNKAKGIALKKTKVSSDNRRGVVEGIHIYPEKDQFHIVYRIERLDENGVPFSDVNYNSKKHVFMDEGAWGDVDVDPATGFPDMSTFKETKPENLQVTDWDKQLGTNILGSAIAFIELKEKL